MQDRSHFLAQMRRQFSFMERSCHAYDSGGLDEAIRLATSVRVIVHNTKNSTSLLSHLGASKIRFLSTVDSSKVNLNTCNFFYGLGGMRFDAEGQSGPYPLLEETNFQQPMPAEKWWEQVVYVSRPIIVRRRDLVLAAANQDGGAHVDKKFAPAYEMLQKHMLVRVKRGEPDKVVDYVHLMGLRQVAYEVMHSPELVALLQ
jgi:hypothetical protein